jgi:excinuclease ABC subunit A
MNFLKIKGARQHNLKNIDLTIPKNKLVVFTGLSGSGKSSLAFDTIYAEGQRRYVESLSSYARQFLGLMTKPDLDSIEGLSPAIAIDQKTTSHNPRSTVGTITEIYDYLRLLYARIGRPHCPKCHQEIQKQSLDQIVDQSLALVKQTLSSSPSRFMVLSPIIRDKKGEFTELLKNLKSKGIQRVRIDGQLLNLDVPHLLIKTNRHTIDAVIERLTVSKLKLANPQMLKDLIKRLTTSFETALKLSNGLGILVKVNDPSLEFPEKPTKMVDHLFSENFACESCNLSLPEIEPRIFSFNSPHGACPTCTGLGTLLKIDPSKIIAPNLTISEGAIIPFANQFSTDSWQQRILKTLFMDKPEAFKTPWAKLPENIQNQVLYGSNKVLHVTGENKLNKITGFKTKYEGVIKNLERRFEETKSDYMRNEINKYMTKKTCPDCLGARLKPESLSVTLDKLNINQLTELSIKDIYEFISTIAGPETSLNIVEQQIGKLILKEIKARLNFLISVGLDYLNLARQAATLAGGEAQRIRLASQIGTGLTGVLYILDEPSIGLHQKDNHRLIKTLKRLRDLGNTIIVVEHDKEIMLQSDYLVDFGPLAGKYGGEIVALGTPKQVMANSNSLTGAYLKGKKKIDNSRFSVSSNQDENLLTLTGCTQHNLKNIDIQFPLNKLIVVTGVSGSGKSTLIHDTLYHAVRHQLELTQSEPKKNYQTIKGYGPISKVSLIDQSPIGRTPRSNPATYTKAFDHIRELFTQTHDAKTNGFKPGRFSFNVKGGRCESCKGEGQVKIEMQFMPDVYITCDVCHGARYNSQTLEVKLKDKTIADVLSLTVDEALNFFPQYSPLYRKLVTLKQVGLGYIELGQPAPTLSGGEAQRIKLAKELSVQSPGHTLYLLDEPTTGLHFEDLKKLLTVLKDLVDQNNTVIVIEHNLDVIKNADWIIDLGPNGGDQGGKLLGSGTPQDISRLKSSYTGQYLKKYV